MLWLSSLVGALLVVFVFSGFILIVCSVHLVLVATFAALVFLPPTAGGIVVLMFYEDGTCVLRSISSANRNRTVDDKHDDQPTPDPSYLF